MAAIDDAIAVIEAAERRLRLILVQLAETGEYEHVSKIATWAQALSGISSGSAESSPPSHPGAGAPPIGGETQSTSISRRSERAQGSRRKKSLRGGKKKPEYPRFVREGDTLVKIGWSKSEGKTYEHKAPHVVLRSLIQSLVRAGAHGERFVVEKVLPLRNTDKSEIPDYQAYLTLAWLRHAGLVIQHGRQGYSLLNSTALGDEAERMWNVLPLR